MAMPRRDDLIDPASLNYAATSEMKRTDALLEYAVRHGEDAEAERLRAKLRHLAGMGDVCECKPVWDGRN